MPIASRHIGVSGDIDRILAGRGVVLLLRDFVADEFADRQALHDD